MDKKKSKNRKFKFSNPTCLLYISANPLIHFMPYFAIYSFIIKPLFAFQYLSFLIFKILFCMALVFFNRKFGQPLIENKVR